MKWIGLNRKYLNIFNRKAGTSFKCVKLWLNNNRYSATRFGDHIFKCDGVIYELETAGFSLIGKYFGYPDCCTFGTGTLRRDDNRYSGTGYLACPACEARHPNKLLSEINRRRTPKTWPFESSCTVTEFQGVISSALFMLDHAKLTAQPNLWQYMDVEFDIAQWQCDSNGFELLHNSSMQLGNCDQAASYMQRLLGCGVIYGFSLEDNPSATYDAWTKTYGHTFLVIDNRYIVDVWLSFFHDTAQETVWDLHTDDPVTLRQYYGDPSKWTVMPKRSTGFVPQYGKYIITGPQAGGAST